MTPPTQLYDAFISYSHGVDGKLAPAIQTGLHRFAKPWYRLRAMRVFRDETSLAATPELWPSIVEALDNSRWLVLLASPAAATSEWVNDEVDHWLATRSAKRLIVVVTDDRDGNFDWQATTALPPALREHLQLEPRVVDLRWARASDDISLANGRFRDAIADIAAEIHERPKDELYGDDVRQHRRTRRLARGAASTLAVLLAAAVVAGVVAVSQRDRARHEQQLGVSRALAATSLSLIPVHSELSRMLAIEAISAGRTRESVSAARRAILESRLRVILTVSRPLAARFSGDGRQIVTVGEDGVVRRWDAESGRALSMRQLPLKRGETLVGAVVSPDRRFLLVRTERSARRGSFRFAASLLDVASGDVKAQQIGRPGEVAFLHLSFSSDGRRALVSGDNVAIVWQVPSGRRLAVLDHGGSTQDAAISADGKLAIIGGVFAVEVWDVASQRRIVRLAPYFENLESVAVSADRKLVAASGLRQSDEGGNASAAYVWDVRTHRRLALLDFAGAHVAGGEVFSKLAFSPRAGSPLIALSTGATVRLWNGRTGQVTTVLSGHQAPVETIAFSPDARLLATGSSDHTARVWQLASGQTVDLLNGFSGGITDISFDPHADRVLTIGGDGSVRGWRVGTTRDVERRWTPERARLLTCGPFRRKGDSSPSACIDTSGRVWDVTDGKKLAMRAGVPVLLRQPNLSFAGFSSDGGTLLGTSVLRATTGRSAKFRVIVADGDNGRILRDIRIPSREGGLFAGAVDFASLSPDGRQVVTSGRSGLLAWNARGEGSATELGSGSMIESGTFSNDGRYFLGEGGGSPTIWRTSDWSLVGNLANCEKFSSPFAPSVFNREATALASICGSTVRISNVEGQTIRTMTDLDASDVEGLAFSPDGSLLLAVTGSGLVRVWETDSGRRLRDVRVLELAGYLGLKYLRLNDRGRIAFLSPEVFRLYQCEGCDAVRLYECEVCGGIDEVLAQACRGLARGFTVDERVNYLHEPRTRALAAGSIPKACLDRTRLRAK